MHGDGKGLSSELGDTDKDKQFQWFVNDEQLQQEAIGVLDVAYTSDSDCGNHLHGYVTPDSEYELIFIRKRNRSAR